MLPMQPSFVSDALRPARAREHRIHQVSAFLDTLPTGPALRLSDPVPASTFQFRLGLMPAATVRWVCLCKRCMRGMVRIIFV
jgi:hypothetical protein